MVDLKTVAEDSKASQDKDELEWLLKQIIKIKPKVILEIGVHQGYSLETWYAVFNPTLLIGIDNDLNDLKWQTNSIIIEADSHSVDTLNEVKIQLEKQKIDFLFIDGDHTLEGVKQDYEMYGPLVRKGGIIAFHDAVIKDHPIVEVYKFLAGLHHNIKYYIDGGTGVAIINV